MTLAAIIILAVFVGGCHPDGIAAMMRDRGGYTPHHDRPHEWREDSAGNLHLWYGMDRGGIVRCFDIGCFRQHLWARIAGDSREPTPEQVAEYNAIMDPTGPECVALMPGEVTSL